MGRVTSLCRALVARARRVSPGQGDFHGAPPATNSASHFEPADHLLLDGSDSPNSPENCPLANCRASAGEHGRVGPRVRKRPAKVAGPIVKNRRVARRTSDAEGVDDVPGRAHHPGWIDAILEAGGQRPVSPCGPARESHGTSCRESGIGRKRGRRSTGGILGGGRGFDLVVCRRSPLLGISPFHHGGSGKQPEATWLGGGWV